MGSDPVPQVTATRAGRTRAFSSPRFPPTLTTTGGARSRVLWAGRRPQSFRHGFLDYPEDDVGYVLGVPPLDDDAQVVGPPDDAVRAPRGELPGHPGVHRGELATVPRRDSS